MPPTTTSVSLDETTPAPALRETRESFSMIAGGTFEASALDLDGYDELPFTD